MSQPRISDVRLQSGVADAPLAVVVVTYNSRDVLPGLLDSLGAGLSGVGLPQVIVVDNESEDGSADLALRHPAAPRVIRSGRNGGYAAAINIASRVIPPDADLLVLNPDIRLLPAAARRLQHHIRQTGAGIVVPQILHPDGSVRLSIRRDPSLATAWSESLLGGRLSTALGISEIVCERQLYRNGGPIEWATGAAVMISARARRAVGKWDESFFLYSEEVDYMRRARDQGFSIEYVSTAQAAHIGGDYLSSAFLSALMTTNRIRYYGRRHGPAKTALFRLSVAMGEAIRSVRGKAHRASFIAAVTAPPR